MDITEICWSAWTAKAPHEPVVYPTVLRVEDFWPETKFFAHEIVKKALTAHFATGDAWQNLIGDDETECKLTVHVTAPTPAIGYYHVEVGRCISVAVTKLADGTEPR